MPEKEKPLQGEPLRGSDTPTIAERTTKNKIPQVVIERLEREICGLEFGGVSLIVAVRDGHPTFRIEKTISVMTGV